MCETCGCSDHSRPRLTDMETGLTIALDAAPTLGHAHEHEHSHTGADFHHHHHHHDHAHPARPESTITMETAVLARNDHLAAHNRDWLADRGVLALNLVSSP